MTQGDRSLKIIAFMSWLVAKEKTKSLPTPLAAKRHIEKEITAMGGSPRTIAGYLKRLEANALICMRGGKIVPTAEGKNWLEKKVS